MVVEGLRSAAPSLAPEDAKTLLHGYAAAGRPRLVEILLAVGACHVDARRSKDSCTAMHIAAYRAQEGVIAVLRAHSADETLRNKWDETPADVAPASAAAPAAK